MGYSFSNRINHNLINRFSNPKEALIFAHILMSNSFDQIVIHLSLMRLICALAVVYVCAAKFVQVFDNGESTQGQDIQLTEKECRRTMWRLSALVASKTGRNGTFTLFGSSGQPIFDCNAISEGMALYLVPQGRFFMHPTITISYRSKIF
jgi:hypothetical protein